MAEQTQQKQLITILSIDGGGIRGVIPATILCRLEEVLQKIDGEQARIADYFDIIAGMSTGSLIAALLVAPEDETGRPRSASEIIDVFKTEGPQIFSKESELAYQAVEKLGKVPEGSSWGKFSFHMHKYAKKWWKKFSDPRYDGQHLRNKVCQLLGELKLSDTMKNVVIPAFNIKEKYPMVFSSKQAVKSYPGIRLSDVVISSSAAPYYFPSYSFNVEQKEYELIDGGLAANNPTLLAIGEAKKEYSENPERSYRILSLGTGTVKSTNVPDMLFGSGGFLDLFIPTGGAPPMVEMMFRANAVTTDMYTSTVLGKCNQFPFYLRIQEYDLKKELDSMNVSSPENLADLERVARDLLANPVTVADSRTGSQEPLKGQDTPRNSGDALVKFARMLAREKKASPPINDTMN